MESASSEAGALRLTCPKLPWKAEDEPQRFSLSMPLSEGDLNAFHITLDAGYGVNATLVHSPEGVAAIEQRYRDGAGFSELKRAIHFASGLPEAIAERLSLPFDPEDGSSSDSGDGAATVSGGHIGSPPGS